MKTSTLLILAMAILALKSTPALAAVDLLSYQTTIQEINSLEKSNPNLAAIKSLTAANEIAAAVGLDAVVASVSSSLNEIQQEVVTSTQNSGFNFSFFGLFSGGAHRRVDLSQMVTVNADEVAGFGAKQIQDFRNLQAQLGNYVKQNELTLFYAKILAAKALQLTATLPLESLRAIYPAVGQAVQKISFVNFAGEYSVSHCVTTNHANKVDEKEASISAFFLSLSASDNTTQHAYSSTSCSNSSGTTQIDESKIISWKLTLADQAIANYSKTVSLRLLVEEKAPVYPTWGSPAFNR